MQLPPINNKALKKKKKLISPYKNRKNKTCFGKNSFGENLGGGEKKHEPNSKKN